MPGVFRLEIIKSHINETMLDNIPISYLLIMITISLDMYLFLMHNNLTSNKQL